MEQNTKESDIKQTLSLSSSFTMVKEYSVPGIDSSWHVLVDKSDRLWVSDYRGICVQTDLQGNKIKSSGGSEGYDTVPRDEDLIYTDQGKKVIYRITPDE